MKLEKIKNVMANIGASATSIIKVALLSKFPFRKSPKKDGAIVIMGNGPSLRKTIDNDIDKLCGHELMAVNFAANAPDFILLRPQYYILADGHFFSNADKDPNVRKLWDNISDVSWEMKLFVPIKYLHLAKAFLINSKNVELLEFNLTPVEGNKFVIHSLMDAGLGMPRPRNVMIPAIMCAIRLGYKRIYLCGADHSWTKTLDVDNENFVISRQPHFYEDNSNELERVRETYKGIKLYQVLESMTIAFRSYWEIADYIKGKDIEIINATPGSMIDAFKRGSL